MTPSELITAVRAKIASISELRAKGTQGTWEWEGICDNEADAMLTADRVNSTEEDLALVQGLCAVYENFSVDHVAHAIADRLLTDWLRGKEEK